MWDCTGILGCEVVPNICAQITGTNCMDSHSCEKYWVTCGILTDLHSMFTVQGCSTIDYTVHLYITHIISVPHKLHTLYIHCMHSNTQSTNMQVFTWLCIDNTPVSMNVLKMKAVEMHTCMNACMHVYRMCTGSVISGYDLSSVELFDPVMEPAMPLFYVAMATLEYSPQTNLTFITSPQ